MLQVDVYQRDIMTYPKPIQSHPVPVTTFNGGVQSLNKWVCLKIGYIPNEIAI